MTLELSERSVWQVAAGTHDRTYADQFLNHGVALIGPGDPGPWDPKRSDEEFGGAFVRRFAVELCKGDILLLRTGPSTIRAVGLVACDYQYLPQFDDVNGWDLQHCRRVRWSELPEPHDFGCQVGNGSRLSRVYSETVVEYANRFVQSSPTDWQKCALPRLPQKEAILTAPPCYLEGLVAQVHDLVPRYWNSDAFAELPTEDELVAHYVVPFLRALGWPVKKIAVKWRHIDVSVFSKLPRVPEHCRYVVEAKRLGAGVEGALEQAIGYVRDLDGQCDVVVTDGVRYRMYDAARNFEPVAYANLARLKESSLELFNRMRSPQSED